MLFAARVKEGKMKKFKILIVSAIGLSLVLIGQLFVLAQTAPRWENLCQSRTNPYCLAVDKQAYNNDSVPIPLRGLKLGKITGVVWLAKGQTISRAGESLKIAPRNDYYYIIDNDIADPFLRLCSEIEVETEAVYEGFSPN